MLARAHRGEVRNEAEHAEPSAGAAAPSVEPASCHGMRLPVVMTVDELASLLRVDRKTAYAAIQRREIPGVRHIGGVIRISRDAVLAWLGQGQGRAARSRRSP